MIKLGTPQGDTKELRVRLFVLGGVFLLGLFVLAVNLYRLMVVRYEEFYVLSQDNQFKDVRLRAQRGLIKDRRGEVLVDSRPSFDVFVTPAFCQKCSKEVLPSLAEDLGWDEERAAQVEAMLKAAHGPQRYQPLIVQVDVSRGDFDKLNAHSYLLPGVDLVSVPHRNYRAGSALAHVLGYMNEIEKEEIERLNDRDAERPRYALGEYIGRRGVERSLENVLRGRDGWVKQVVDARGEVIRDPEGKVITGDELAPTPGKNVVLSIDARLQAEAERVFPGVAGAIVALESKTGFVLAMVSRPAFDPNEMTGRVSSQKLAALNKDPLQPMVFRAAAEHYHPGSTFKPVTLLAALQTGVYTPTTTVVCPGHYQLGGRVWRCHKESGHGPVQARSALQVSCDTYFYHAGDLMGIDPIAKVGRAFGLGALTNLNVAAEVPGVMPDSQYHDQNTPGGYTKGLALNTAIGQGDVNVTPLQLGVLYSAIANGGSIYQPQLVRRIETASGQTVEEFAPKLVRQAEMTPDQQHLIVDALKAVVNEPGGTALRARMANVVVAGKTGTAQVAKLGAVRIRKEAMDYFQRDHAWFVAFAPADDPEITVVVLNEHGGHGGSDAAPAAAAVLKRYFELKSTDGQAFGPDWQSPAPPPATKPSGPTPPLTPPRAISGTAVAATPVDAGREQVATPTAPPLPAAPEVQ